MAYPGAMRTTILAALSTGLLLGSLACTSEEVVWPISKSAALDADPISSPFGPRDQGGDYDFHAGVDFALEEGTKVRAIKAGTVEKTVAWDGDDGTGNWVLVDHGGGEKSAYLHLSKISTRQGSSVRAGEVIGRSGSTGGTTPHLHLTYMVGVEGNGGDEEMARNVLEILPHSDMPDPEVEFTASGVLLTMPVRPMSVQQIRLEGGGEAREIDYGEIVAQGNPDRDDQVQGGIFIDVERQDSLRFQMTLEPEPADFVPDRVELRDYFGDVIFDASR